MNTSSTKYMNEISLRNMKIIESNRIFVTKHTKSLIPEGVYLTFSKSCERSCELEESPLKEQDNHKQYTYDK